MNSTGAQQSKAATVHDLTGLWRGVVLWTGLCSLTSGGVAVFTSTNQAGTLGLLVVGAVAMLLAIVGRIPLRWVISGNEFDMTKEVEAAEVLTEAVATNLGPESTKAIADQLFKSDPARLRATTAAMLDWVAFEQGAMARVTGAVTSRPGWTFTAASDDVGLDGTVRDPNGRSVGVEFKLARTRSDFVAWFERIKGMPNLQPIVLVVSGTASMSMASRDYLESLSDRGDVYLAELENPDFERQFLAACDKAIARATP